MSEELTWRQLVETNGPALVLLARQHGCSLEEAEDAVQEGLLSAWRNRSAVNDLRAYAFSCVRSAALDRRKSEQRRSRREDYVRDRTAPDRWFAAPTDRSALHAELQAVLAQLPDEQREVVVMKIWGGLTFAQIGEALSVPLNTAASRYRYALEQLRERMSGGTNT